MVKCYQPNSIDTPAGIIARAGAQSLDDAFVALTGRELEDAA